MIQQQIKVREQQRLLDAEKKDQETQAMLKYLERLQEEDMENLHKKRQSQKQLMEEVAECNEVRLLYIRDTYVLHVYIGTCHQTLHPRPYTHNFSMLH